MLASSGQVDLYTLQKLLTHKNAAMTQRYAHLRDEALQKAANLAGNLIEQITNGVMDLKKERESDYRQKIADYSIFEEIIEPTANLTVEEARAFVGEISRILQGE